MTNRMRAWFELVLGLSGLSILIYSAGWMVGLGVFLMFFGNNFRRPPE